MVSNGRFSTKRFLLLHQASDDVNKNQMQSRQKMPLRWEAWVLPLALAACKKVDGNAGRLSGRARSTLDAGRVGFEHRKLPVEAACDDNHPCAQPYMCMPFLGEPNGTGVCTRLCRSDADCPPMFRCNCLPYSGAPCIDGLVSRPGNYCVCFECLERETR